MMITSENRVSTIIRSDEIFFDRGFFFVLLKCEAICKRYNIFEQYLTKSAFNVFFIQSLKKILQKRINVNFWDAMECVSIV